MYRRLIFARVSSNGENTLIILRSAFELNVSRDPNKLFFLIAAFETFITPIHSLHPHSFPREMHLLFIAKKLEVSSSICF